LTLYAQVGILSTIKNKIGLDMENKISEELFKKAAKVVAASGSKVTYAVVHATELHMVYGVPVTKCMRASGTPEKSRNSIYKFKETIEKTIKYMES
jgi:hypothetical protein